METKVTALQPLRLERVQELLRSDGPRITILLPPYRPGEQGKPMAALLKSHLAQVEQQLALRKIAQGVTSDLLKPLEELTRDEEFLGGSHSGRAIFRSRDFLEQYDLLGHVKPQFVVGNYFCIRGILADLNFPREFYLLKLSKKDVELLRCIDFRAERVKLPVPSTLEEAMAFKPPDHDLENRSSAGGSAGDMRGVRFGTTSVSEKQRAHLADFYKMTDRGIMELLHAGSAPLVLSGVDEDTAAYRTVHTYPNLLGQSIHGSANGGLSEQDLLQQAYSIIRAEQAERSAASLMESMERLAPGRFSTDLETILRASSEGRVDKLYVDENAPSVEDLPDVSADTYPGATEDLLNVAVVQTILHRGSAVALPSGKMPRGASIAAAFRY